MEAWHTCTFRQLAYLKAGGDYGVNKEIEEGAKLWFAAMGATLDQQVSWDLVDGSVEDIDVSETLGWVVVGTEETDYAYLNGKLKGTMTVCRGAYVWDIVAA